MFGPVLVEIYRKFNSAKCLIASLLENAKKVVQLMLSREDERCIRAAQFLENPEENASALFHFIWHASMEVRARNITQSSEFARTCMLTKLMEIPDDTDEILTALLNRYHLVNWIISDFKDMTAMHSARERVILELPEALPQEQIFATLSESLIQSSSSTGRRIHIVRPSSSLCGGTKMSLNSPFEARRTMKAARLGDISDLHVPAPIFTVDRQEGSRSAQIERLLRGLFEQSNLQVLRDETALLLNIFQFLDSQRSQITSLSEGALQELLIYGKELAHKKCTKEMENFSRNFRRFKNEGKFDGKLFQIDISMLAPDIIELWNALDGNIPKRDEIPMIPSEQLIAMFREFHGKMAVSSAELLEAAVNAGVSEKNRWLMKACILMNLQPTWIDVRSFFEVFAIERNEVLELFIEPPEKPPDDVAVPIGQVEQVVVEEEEGTKPAKTSKRRTAKK
jgi:hypothetical protein